MGNDRIQAARDYHDGTKHPGGNLMSRAHTFDPMRRPMPFKIYSSLEPMPLPRDLSPVDVPALTAIARDTAPCEAHRTPDIDSLARILHYSAGITKLLKYPWGDMTFRAAACTGALYHIELYLVCGDLPGLAAGVYHFDPSETALRRLRAGDYRSVLGQAAADEPAVAAAPATIVYTDVVWRNACKYQAREYRHAFWDSGTIVANSLAVCSALGLPSSVVAGFSDETVDRLLDLDTQKEMAVALQPVGHAPEGPAGPPPEAAPLGLETMPISDFELDFPAIREFHRSSSLSTREEVAAWRGPASGAPAPEPMGRLTALEPQSEPDAQGSPLESVIVRRGSTRRFSQGPITFAELSTILNRAMGDVPADFHEPPSRPLNDAYLIANAVDGLDAGAYFFHRERQTLELLEAGELRTEAGHLGLDQSLPADASINIFMMTDLERVLERFGNRGYRAAQLEASVTAGRVYLAAYALGLGATGLTFFDDAVTDFFSPHAQGKSAMFLVAVGKRARRR